MIETIYSDPNFLAHYGVKGMKWGIRKDGFTNSISGGQGGKAQGTERYAASSKETTNVKKKLFEQSIKKGKGKENSSPAEEISKNVKDAAYNAENALRSLDKTINGHKEKTISNNIKNMSDAELRNRINRIEMERKYSSLTAKEVQTGWEKAENILHITGDVAAIALNVALIVGAVKKVKG